jgi:hypothetical protein
MIRQMGMQTDFIELGVVDHLSCESEASAALAESPHML